MLSVAKRSRFAHFALFGSSGHLSPDIEPVTIDDVLQFLLKRLFI